MPLPDKVEAKNIMAIPKPKKQLQRIIGLINYYSNMFKYRPSILTPLSIMTSKQAKWNWSNEYVLCLGRS